MKSDFTNFKPILRFAAMSDIHYRDVHAVERERFEQALQVINRHADNCPEYSGIDALCVVGDFANSGTEIEMQEFKKSIDRYLRPETKLIISFASHEISKTGREAAEEKLMRIFGKAPDVHEIIKGFHFISLSTSESETNPRCGFNAQKREWFREQMEIATADDPQRPVFMFQHPHPWNTVYGSVGWDNEDLYPIQKDYPALVTFSGHSHAPINDPRSIHQRDFTSLGCGTLSYFELDEFDKVYGTVPPNASKAAQFYIVEADEEKRVRVLLYDLITDRFFPEVWLIEKAWDKDSFAYTNSREGSECEPYFSEGDKISISDVTEDGCMLTFPQAKIDSYRVNSYYITLGDPETGLEEKRYSIWSEYYFYDMPKTLSFKLEGLKKGRRYAIGVYATSFWGRPSKERLTAEITL